MKHDTSPQLALASPLARPLSVQVVARTSLPTRHGQFTAIGFVNNRERSDHLALVRGDVDGAEEVPVRIHSECLTGDTLGSLRCDCREQLELALERLGREPRGVLLYLRQEGRGIGLVNKLRAYALQERGLDTVDANRALGFRDDERDYEIAAAMLGALGVRSVRLLTNNPSKIVALERHGVRVAARVPHEVAPGEHNRRYLETKVRRSGHLMGIDEPTESVDSRRPSTGSGRPDDVETSEGGRPSMGRPDEVETSECGRPSTGSGRPDTEAA